MFHYFLHNPVYISSQVIQVSTKRLRYWRNGLVASLQTLYCQNYTSHCTEQCFIWSSHCICYLSLWLGSVAISTYFYILEFCCFERQWYCVFILCTQWQRVLPQQHYSPSPRDWQMPRLDEPFVHGIPGQSLRDTISLLRILVKRQTMSKFLLSQVLKELPRLNGTSLLDVFMPCSLLSLYGIIYVT